MAPLVLQVSMGGGDRLPSGDPSARLPSYFIKKIKKYQGHIYLDNFKLCAEYMLVLAPRTPGS